MNTWEYGTLICHYESGFLTGSNYWTWQGERIEVATLDAALNARGAEGWELVASHAHVETDWSEVVYTFKRSTTNKS